MNNKNNYYYFEELYTIKFYRKIKFKKKINPFFIESPFEYILYL